MITAVQRNLGMVFWIATLSAAHLGMVNDYPASLEGELKSGLESVNQDPADPNLHIKVASLYLDLGDDLYQEKEKRLVAYESGTRFAMRALELKEGSAEAHFLYAANLGNAAQLKGSMASAMVVQRLKEHLHRALELKNNHAPALHMMGVMLDELPWLLGGDGKTALESVKRAVSADPDYAHARLDLAKMYWKRHDFESAKQELRTLVTLDHPRDQYAWETRYRPEGLRLLNVIAVDSLKQTGK